VVCWVGLAAAFTVLACPGRGGQRQTLALSCPITAWPSARFQPAVNHEYRALVLGVASLAGPRAAFELYERHARTGMASWYSKGGAGHWCAEAGQFTLLLEQCMLQRYLAWMLAGRHCWSGYCLVGCRVTGRAGLTGRVECGHCSWRSHADDRRVSNCPLAQAAADRAGHASVLVGLILAWHSPFLRAGSWRLTAALSRKLVTIIPC